MLAQMLTPSAIKQELPPETFQATLRPYQQTGYNWLKFMQNQPFGALLADDMGLGKTIQILALLDSLKEQKNQTLLVIPASLIANWKKETSTFAPSLNYKVLHGKEIDLSDETIDLYITTYGMVSKIPALKEKTFDLLLSKQ